MKEISTQIDREKIRANEYSVSCKIKAGEDTHIFATGKDIKLYVNGGLYGNKLTLLDRIKLACMIIFKYKY